MPGDGVEVGKGYIQISADAEGLEEEVQAEAEKVKAEIKVPAVLDREDFDAGADEVRRVVAELNELRAVISADMNIDDLLGHAEEAKAVVDDLNEKVAEVRASMNIDDLAEHAAEAIGIKEDVEKSVTTEFRGNIEDLAAKASVIAAIKEEAEKPVTTEFRGNNEALAKSAAEAQAIKEGVGGGGAGAGVAEGGGGGEANEVTELDKALAGLEVRLANIGRQKVDLKFGADDEEAETKMATLIGQAELITAYRKVMMIAANDEQALEVFRQLMVALEKWEIQAERGVTIPVYTADAKGAIQSLDVAMAECKMEMLALRGKADMDTDEAKAKMAELRAQLEIMTAMRRTIKVDMSVDTEKLAADYAAGVALLEAASAAHPIEEKEEFDTSELTAAIAKVRSEMAGLQSDIAILRITGEAGPLEALLAELKLRLDALTAIEHEIHVRMAEGATNEELDAIMSKVGILARTEARPKVLLDTTQLDESMARVEAKLATLQSYRAIMRLGGLDTTAIDADIDREKAHLDALTAVKHEVRVGVDQGASPEKLDDIQARVEVIDHLAANPKIKLETTELNAKITEVRLELSDLQEKYAIVKMTGEDEMLKQQIDDAKLHLEALTAVDHRVKLQLENGPLTIAQLDMIRNRLLEIDALAEANKLDIGDSQARGGGGLGGALENLGDAAMKSGGIGIGGMATMMAPALIPAAGALAGALWAIIPSIGAGITSALAGFAGSGIMGVIKTLEAGKQFTITPQQQLQNNATLISNQQSLESATHGVTTALQGEAEAYFNVAAQARSSQMSLQQAQQGVVSAQEGVTQAVWSQQAAQFNVGQQARSNQMAMQQAQQGVVAATEGATEAVWGQQAAYFNLGSTARSNLMSMMEAQNSVVTSSHALQAAEFTEGQALWSLTIARQNARFALQNYTNQLADSTLATQASREAVQAALINMQHTLADPATYAYQRQQAITQYQQALQAVKDQATANQQLKITAKEAQDQGISGNPAVQAAVEAVLQAQQGVTQAAIAQKEAWLNLNSVELNNAQATRQVAQAYTEAKWAGQNAAIALKEAWENLTNTKLSDAEATKLVQQAETSAGWGRINAIFAEKLATESLINTKLTNKEQTLLTAQAYANAIFGVTTATGSLKETYAEIAASAASMNPALSTFNNDFALLTPAGQKFVTWWQANMKPLLENFELKDSKAFFTGLQSGFDALMPVMKMLFEPGKGQQESPFVAAAKGMTDAFVNLGKFLGSKEGVSLLKEVMAGGNSFFKGLGDSLPNGVEAFLKIGAAGAGWAKELGNETAIWSKSLLNWVDNGGLDRFEKWMKTNLPLAITFISNLLGALKDFGEAMGSLGPATLKTWADVLKDIGDFMKNNPQFTAFVAEVVVLSGALKALTIVPAAIKALGALFGYGAGGATLEAGGAAEAGAFGTVMATAGGPIIAGAVALAVGDVVANLLLKHAPPWLQRLADTQPLVDLKNWGTNLSTAIFGGDAGVPSPGDLIDSARGVTSTLTPAQQTAIENGTMSAAEMAQLGISSFGSSISDEKFISTLPAAVQTMLGYGPVPASQKATVSNNWKSLGTNAMQGVQEGIKSGSTAVNTEATTAMNNAVATCRAALLCGSPSQVMKKVGEEFMQGFGTGLTSGMLAHVTAAGGPLTTLDSALNTALPNPQHAGNHWMELLGTGLRSGFQQWVKTSANNGPLDTLTSALKSAIPDLTLPVPTYSAAWGTTAVKVFDQEILPLVRVMDSFIHNYNTTMGAIPGMPHNLNQIVIPGAGALSSRISNLSGSSGTSSVVMSGTVKLTGTVTFDAGGGQTLKGFVDGQIEDNNAHVFSRASSGVRA